MNTQEEFEKLWNPICPEYDSISSSHVFKFYEACKALNDKRIAELEEKLSEVVKFQGDVVKMAETISHLHNHIYQLNEKLRVAEIDAERYRWIKTNAEKDSPNSMLMILNKKKNRLEEPLSHLDEAIDEAREVHKIIEE